MKEFSTYYYAKAQEVNPRDYCDVKYFEPEVSVQDSVAIQMCSSKKISCCLVCNSMMVKSYE